MTRITAEAALLALRENNPSLVFDCVALAGGGDIGNDGPAEEVVAAVSAVDSFTVVLRIVESLSIDSVGGLVLDVALVEIDVERVVVVGSSDPQGEAQKCAQQEYSHRSEIYNYNPTNPTT